MPQLTNAEAQSLSAVVRSVMQQQNVELNNARSVMRGLKCIEKMHLPNFPAAPKHLKNAAWKSIYKGGLKLKRNEELQTVLKRHLAKAEY